MLNKKVWLLPIRLSRLSIFSKIFSIFSTCSIWLLVILFLIVSISLILSEVSWLILSTASFKRDLLASISEDKRSSTCRIARTLSFCSSFNFSIKFIISSVLPSFSSRIWLARSEAWRKRSSVSNVTDSWTIFMSWILLSASTIKSRFKFSISWIRLSASAITWFWRLLISSSCFFISTLNSEVELFILSFKDAYNFDLSSWASNRSKNSPEVIGCQPLIEDNHSPRFPVKPSLTAKS